MIALREGLEAALVAGIILACLNRTGRRNLFPPVLFGAAGALALSGVGGWVLYSYAGGLSAKSMEIFEGAMMLTAALLLTYMLLWMQRQARSMAEGLKHQVEAALTGNPAPLLAWVAFTVVIREGLETVLFLAAGARAQEGALYTLGAVLGAAAGRSGGLRPQSQPRSGRCLLRVPDAGRRGLPDGNPTLQNCGMIKTNGGKRVKRPQTMLAALFLTLALAGCSTASTGREIAIEMTDYKLSPAQVTVKAGESVDFALTNKSQQDHEFESDEGQFEEVVVPPGQTRKAAWEAPTKPGEYIFECDMAGHDGMEMTIKVEP